MSDKHVTTPALAAVPTLLAPLGTPLKAQSAPRQRAMAGDIGTTPAQVSSPPAQPKDRFSPLSKVPIDIASHRQLIFALETPVQFDEVAWNKYWPYVDNIWCIHTKHHSVSKVEDGKIAKFWGGCRLERKWVHGSQGRPLGDGTRKRKRREMGQCQAKFRLTVLPNGIRILERSKEAHSHDLDYIDSVKRCTGIRNVVTDPFFSGWEAAGILAFLKDPAHHIDGHDLLREGGGKYLERREILNIFAQTLRKAYPHVDPHAIKEARDKYQGMKTCNFKGCNRAFSDAKQLTQHRRTEHEEVRHDHSDKLYTCPCKTCHRRKRSKGFATVEQLRDHQLRVQHWGQGVFHGDGGPRLVEPVTETDGLRSGMAGSSTVSGAEANPADVQLTLDQAAMQQQVQQPQPTHSAIAPLPVPAVIPQHLTPSPANMTMIPLMAGAAAEGLAPPEEGHQHLLIDPAMQMQQHPPPTLPSTPHNPQQHQQHQQISGATDEMTVIAHQRQNMMQRLHQLEIEKARMEQEMQNLRSALFVG